MHINEVYDNPCSKLFHDALTGAPLFNGSELDHRIWINCTQFLDGDILMANGNSMKQHWPLSMFNLNQINI